jgi:TP901 family phage tail tape measure protein
MTAAAKKFGRATTATFERIDRAQRRVTNGFKKMLGQLGQLGLAFGAMAIINTVAVANMELETSMASLQAITGVTQEEFKGFEKQVSSVAKAQGEFAADTAKAFEIVASAQPVLLKNADALGEVTNAAITLSKASRDDLAASAQSLTGVMNQFNLGADEAARTMNVLAAGSVAGSANITNVAASMKNFGSVAAGANIELEEAVALVEVMGSKTIFAEDAGNKLKAAVLNLQGAGLGYESGLFNINDALTTLRKRVDAARTAKEKDEIITKVFKKTGITTGQILLNNIDKFNELTTAVTGTTTAVDQAQINSSTLAAKFKELKNSFLNSVTTTNAQNDAFVGMKKVLQFTIDNMDKIIKVVGIAIIVIAAFKTVMAIATAAQWAFNAAAAANPIGLIIIAIVAVIAAVTILVLKWEELTKWFKESSVGVKLLLTPLLIANSALIAIAFVIRKLIDLWKKLRNAFESDGWTGVFKRIGKSLLSFVLRPIQEIIALVNKVSGGKIGGDALAKITSLREGLNAETEGEGEVRLNREAAQETARSEKERTTKNDRLEIGVTGQNGAIAEVLNNAGGLPVNVTNTLGWQDQ